MYILARYTDDGKDARAIGGYATLRGAKCGLAAKIKSDKTRGRLDRPRFFVMEQEEFERLFNYPVPVTSLMTGLTVWIRNQERGGPCDPSTERYWTM